MPILAINTAAAACDLAIVDDDRVLAEWREDMARGQDARLPGAVQDMLAGAGLGLADIDRIGVVCGPGSFTGVRIGVAFARGLSLTLGIDCVGVSSLEASLPEGTEAPHRVALIARRRPPDISFWTQDIAGLKALGPPEERARDAVAGKLPVLTDRPDLIEAAGTCAPSAAIAGLRAARLSPGTHPARPLYVREPDADLPAGRR